MLRTDYRFTLTRDTDTFEVTPSGFFDGSFKDEQAEGQLFFRRKLDAELSFSGSDYAYIKTRYDAGNYCDTYELLIEKKVLGVYQVDWQGFFSMTDGKFDFERCRFNTSVTLQDKYSCILNNWETEVNILKQTPINIQGQATSFFVFYATNTANEIDLPATVLYNGSAFTFPSPSYLVYKQRVIGPVSDRWFGLYAAELMYIKKDKIPLGSGWVLGATNDQIDIYVRPWNIYNALPSSGQALWIPNTAPIGGDYTTMKEQSPNELGYSGHWLRILNLNYSTAWLLSTYYAGMKIDGDNIFTYRGYSLINTISYLYEQTCETIVVQSKFLTDYTNPVTGIRSLTDKLFLIQKSDAKRPEASNPATIGNLTLKKLFECLYNIFQLWWYIDDNGILTIIHQSEIENNLGLDITVDPYIKTTAHKKAFQFDKTLLYRYETWKFAEANGDDFVGQSIEYSELCTTKETVNKTKSYDLDIITTDLAYIQRDLDTISDDGFLLVSTRLNQVTAELGAITGNWQMNGHLSTANLQDKYWRHNRILSTGKLNGVDVAFISTQKIKKLVEQTIILCEDYDPLKQVTTELGPANVKESNFFPLDKRLVLNMSI